MYHTYEKLLWSWPLRRILHETFVYDVFQYGWECVALGKFGCRLEHDLLKKIKDALRAARFVCTIASERKLSDGELVESKANAPHVGLDGVRRALDAFRGHVSSGANKGLCHRAIQFARDAEVANLDTPTGIDEDVGWFDISVHYLVLAVQVFESTQHGFRNFAKHVDSNWAEVLGNVIERTA